MENVIDRLIKENEFPIIFLGSGISKRFLLDFPDWEGLLKEFWEAVGMTNFYGNMNNIRDEISKENTNYSDREKDHFTLIKIGSLIEEKFNRKFNKGDIYIEGFSPEQAYSLKISPFKKSISNRFKNYTFKEDIQEEVELFSKMLLKAQIILTTNYDTFIEDCYNRNSTYDIDKYIGQKGFFKETYGYSEIYKIHGCVNNPSDIILTEEDYKKFDENSVLISSKIISMLIHSPIMFIGYSLSDINVRNIIKDFTKSLSKEEISYLENKLVLIERKEGENGFKEEVVDDRDLGCKIKVITTDNFSLLFDKISQINQGISPSAVRKYQQVIKQLIVDRGKEGTLHTVLVSPEDLDKIEGDLQNKNLTVAIGDSKYVFQIPDILSYTLDYISDLDEIPTDIRLKFVAMSTGRFPIHKLRNPKILNSGSLHPTEIEKINQKVKELSKFKKHYNSIVGSSVFIKNTNNLQKIIETDTKVENIYETISYNISNLKLEEVKDFLVKEITKLKEQGEIKLNTQIRRLLLLYDIERNLKNKKGNA